MDGDGVFERQCESFYYRSKRVFSIDRTPGKEEIQSDASGRITVVLVRSEWGTNLLAMHDTARNAMVELFEKQTNGFFFPVSEERYRVLCGTRK